MTTSISTGALVAIILAALASAAILITSYILTQRHQRLLPSTHHRLSSRLGVALPLEPSSSHRLSFGARSALARLQGPLALDHLVRPSSTFPGAHTLYRPRAFSIGSNHTSSSSSTNSEPDSAWQTIASATTRTHTTAHHPPHGADGSGFRRLHSAMTRAAHHHHSQTSIHHAATTVAATDTDTEDGQEGGTMKRFSGTSTRSAYALEYGKHFDRSTPPTLPPVDFEVARPVEGMWMTPTRARGKGKGRSGRMRVGSGAAMAVRAVEYTSEGEEKD